MIFLSGNRAFAMGCTVLLALVSFTLMMCGDEASADTEGDLTYDVELGSAVITGTTLSSPSELTIPETLGGYPVAGIRDGAFSSCPYITAFALSGTSTVFSVNGGVLFSADGKILVAYPSDASAVSYSVPSGTVNLGRYAFAGAVNLESVSLPSSMRVIHNYAFSQCGALESVSLPSGLLSIGDRAFEGCTHLESITVPNSVTGIGKYAFSGCGITDIALGSGVTALSEGLFSGCTSLAYISVPASVTVFYQDVFLGCTSLGRIDILKQGTVGFSTGSLRVGTSADPATVSLNCTSPGLVPSEYSDTYTTFEFNTTLFHIYLKQGETLYKDYTFAPGEDVVLDDVPTRTGYTVAWNPAVPGTMTVGDITTVAYWIPDEYDIVFRDGGETYTQTVTYADPATLTALRFERYDKVFLHWKDASDNEFADRAAVDDSLMYNGGSGTILDAVWGDPAFIVRFVPNGGTGTMHDQPVAAGDTVNLRSLAYERTGYIFTDWAWGTQKFTDGQAVCDLATDGSVLLFEAEWTPIRYTVSYDLQGGSGTASPHLAFYGETFELPGQAVSRTGYVMEGWSRTMGSGTVDFGPSELVTNLSVTDGDLLTLYAVWDEVSLTIVFKANGGTGSMPNQVIASGDTDLLDTCTFTSGHPFLGWSDSSGGTVKYADGAEITFIGTTSEQWVLYAVWDVPPSDDSLPIGLMAAAGIIAAVLLGVCAIVLSRR